MASVQKSEALSTQEEESVLPGADPVAADVEEISMSTVEDFSIKETLVGRVQAEFDNLVLVSYVRLMHYACGGGCAALSERPDLAGRIFRLGVSTIAWCYSSGLGSLLRFGAPLHCSFSVSWSTATQTMVASPARSSRVTKVVLCRSVFLQRRHC
eukprot:SAG31_NODE_5003_length_2807_cov_2.203471_3_plen_155_part_00